MRSLIRIETMLFTNFFSNLNFIRNYHPFMIDALVITWRGKENRLTRRVLKLNSRKPALNNPVAK